MNNAEQIDYWNGEAGQRWAAEDARMARMLQPITAALLDHLAPQVGERALDIGCGGGGQTLLLAERLGGTGSVLGIDISAPMLAVARDKSTDLLPEYASVHFLQADAAAHAFEPASFDLLFSRFGVMFFDDPVAAFSNLKRALRPRGRLGFCCWQSLRDNAWAALPLQAALQYVAAPQDTPDPHAPGPFAFADPQRVRAILGAAGFADVSIEAHTFTMVFGERADLRGNVEELVRMGPVARLMADREAASVARMLDAATQALAPYFSDGALRLPGAVWFVQARLAS